MEQHTFHCRQTKPEINILFAIVGFSINVADLFVFAGTSWKNPVPESGTKILTVWLWSYRVPDFRDFVFFVTKGNPFLTSILHVLHKTVHCELAYNHSYVHITCMWNIL